MNENEQMQQFVENIWRNYLKQKVTDMMAAGIRYYRAQVTANPGGGKLTVQRPYDTAVTLPCTSAMSEAAVGSQVTVFVFGSGGGNNSVVVGNGSMSSFGGGGGGGSVTWEDVSGKPTTIAGYSITDAKIQGGAIYLGQASITPVVDENYVHTDKNFTQTLLQKLNGIEDGADANVQSDWNAVSGDAAILNKPTIPQGITVDSALSDSSENPVQNKVVNAALSGKADSDHTHAQSEVTGLSEALEGKADPAIGFDVTLTVAGWSNLAQTVSNASFLATGYAYVVAPDDGSYGSYVGAGCYMGDVTTNGQATFHCETVPSVALTVHVLRIEVGT